MQPQPIPLFHLEVFLNFAFTLSHVLARHRSALLCAAVLSASTAFPVQAAGPSTDSKSQQDAYAAMCVKAVGIPAAHGGEGDLKGNAKVPEYCNCFAGKFLERAMKASPGAPASLEQSMAEEHAMRQSCRTQFKLPPAPKV